MTHTQKDVKRVSRLGSENCWILISWFWFWFSPSLCLVWTTFLDFAARDPVMTVEFPRRPGWAEENQSLSFLIVTLQQFLSSALPPLLLVSLPSSSPPHPSLTLFSESLLSCRSLLPSFLPSLWCHSSTGCCSSCQSVSFAYLFLSNEPLWSIMKKLWVAQYNLRAVTPPTRPHLCDLFSSETLNVKP